ncbi:MAG TPA: Hsp20/alpha crystallin family protein [Candidatus Baltobacteraceae bacterium]|jgi:HSP20 family protein|nr:Hsp20/alpha crystallin family protein [Candidatus Baltobacteraceae bacterium]
MSGFDPFQYLRATNGFEYDVTRTETGYEVEVPVPGFTPNQVEVIFKDGVLTMAGKNERRSFSRSFTIPEDVDVDSIEAKVENGMLQLSLRRHPEAQPKKIDVK